jgi:hypothetical protein
MLSRFSRFSFFLVTRRARALATIPNVGDDEMSVFSWFKYPMLHPNVFVKEKRIDKLWFALAR